jgi:hypothetical protein
MTNPLDHLVWGCPDLDAGVDRLEALTGVRPAYGGSHKGVGTRNALLSLGPEAYLEVMAPDPAQAMERGLGARLRALDQPGLIAWAARSDDLQALADAPGSDRLSPLGPLDMSRIRPDGRTLTWRLLFLGGTTLGFPFFIDWLDSPHPAGQAPPGCLLRGFEVHTPDVGRISAEFAALRLDAPVRLAAATSLRAAIDTPRGPVRLASVDPLAISMP